MIILVLTIIHQLAGHALHPLALLAALPRPSIAWCFCRICGKCAGVVLDPAGSIARPRERDRRWHFAGGRQPMSSGANRLFRSNGRLHPFCAGRIRGPVQGQRGMKQFKIVIESKSLDYGFGFINPRFGRLSRDFSSPWSTCPPCSTLFICANCGPSTVNRRRLRADRKTLCKERCNRSWTSGPALHRPFSSCCPTPKWYGV